MCRSAPAAGLCTGDDGRHHLFGIGGVLHHLPVKVDAVPQHAVIG
jgi:hypothetical protein